MAWNEPGGDGKWGNKGPNQGPPDLDKVIKDLKSKLMGGRKKGPIGSVGGSEGGSTSNKGSGLMAGLIIGALLVLWVLSGIFIVAPAERAVVVTFGKYSSTVGPGPHWIPTFIQSKTVINVQKVDTYSYDAQMLTKDENIVSVAVAVQYRIADPVNYLFNVVSPQESLRQATASSLRQVIGNSTLDQVLTTGREQIREEVAQQLASILTSYKAGILVTDVALQPAKAPDEVKAAFDDAIKAQEDEQRYINQAQAYAMGVEPIARGQAARIMAAATAYKEQVVLLANADIANYLAILPVYQSAPGVTRERMYLDTMQNIFQKTSKVLVDTKGGNLMYLPLNELLKNAGGTSPSTQLPFQVSSAPASPSAAANQPLPSVPMSRDAFNRDSYGTLGTRDLNSSGGGSR